MTETRVERAERVLERLGVELGGEALSDVDVGRQFVYGTVPDWIEVDDVRASLGSEWTTDPAGVRGVVYDVPTFGVTVYVFDAGVVACADSEDRDLAAAAVVATVTKLAATPVDPSADLGLQAVSLTGGSDEEWEPTHDDTVTRRDAGDTAPEADDGDGAEAKNEDQPAVGVTPSPCSDCGRVPDGWERYCPRCGSELKTERCRACDTPLAGWMLYCPACGCDAAGPT